MANKDKPQATYAEIMEGLGDAMLAVYGNEVLIGIYMQPQIRASGLIMPDQVRDEDKWQGKVGIVIAKGPLAFADDAENKVYFYGQNVYAGDHIVYRVSDGFPLDICGIHCRLLQDTEIRMKITDPAIIF